MTGGMTGGRKGRAHFVLYLERGFIASFAAASA
jgi:hypothetical protein